MDKEILEVFNCAGIIEKDFSVIYDEVELAIVQGEDYIRCRIDDISRLIKALKLAETEMLENYKSMNLVGKRDYCKTYDIKYGTLQQIITLRSENDGKE